VNPVVGQCLDDAVVYSFAHQPSGMIGHQVYASLIEDSSQVDLDDGDFTIQDIGSTCPLCSTPITIYKLISSFTGVRVMAQYCADCDLLFRKICIGIMDGYDNYTPCWEVNSDGSVKVKNE